MKDIYSQLKRLQNMFDCNSSGVELDENGVLLWIGSTSESGEYRTLELYFEQEAAFELTFEQLQTMIHIQIETGGVNDTIH
ncbi:hypothetical protein NVP1101O_087 [Vibrio phage 1.101.O._10N.261.45.C6]|nr:hypothetical protein NVP1101O_087 [Vibrio phage 1.101.O._10N.261.45.C6]